MVQIVTNVTQDTIPGCELGVGVSLVDPTIVAQKIIIHDLRCHPLISVRPRCSLTNNTCS
jgi:hypothetical protein